MATQDVDVALSLFGTILALEGVAEGFRRFCQGAKDQPFTNADHCLLSVLYERLEDEAAKLRELEQQISARARKGKVA